jgi:hypothetical protein
MTTTWQTVCGTGHRELDPRQYGVDIWAWVRAETERVLLKLRDVHGTVGAISGLARGFDIELFELVDATSGLTPHACVPFPQQAQRWTVSDRARWQRAIARAEAVGTVRYVGDLDAVPVAERRAAATALLLDRNDVLLLGSAAVIALYDPGRSNHSGTHDAVEKARGRRRLRATAGRQRICRPVVHLNPATRRVGIVQNHLPVDRQLAP